jgi:antitoxin component of RelBE/YafQ-DinJ toxin-antitoxin module
MKKAHTTIRINDFIKAKLREQADKIGMDVSNYIAYLVMYKDEQDKQERRDCSCCE